MKDFEHMASYAMGVALPVLEVARRRAHFAPISRYVDDFLIGALLLYAASLVSRGHPYGPASLVAAWGVLCGGLYYSFFGQLESTAATDVSGLANSTVIAIKGMIYGIALYALYRSVHRVSESRKH